LTKTTTRRTVQLAFLALTLVGVFWVRGNAELWCPLGGVEALYGYLTEGTMICSLGTANFCVLGGVLLMALLLRRAFCAYVCPIGTISEWLGALAARLGIPAGRVRGLADRLLGLAKYAVLAAILLFTWRAGELLFRGYDPCYALISRHGADITWWAYVVAGGVALASLAVALPFCRWLCPMAAVLSPLAGLGLTRIKRDEANCRGCGRCAKACPMAIPVDQVPQVTAARCLSCMRCIEACPHQQAGAIYWGPPRRLGRKWPQAALVALLLLCTGGAVSAAYLFPLPSFVKSRGTPPNRVQSVRLRIENLSCRGRANLLFWFLDRNDLDELPGYLKLEAWPGPGWAEARITFDPAQTDEKRIQRAIVEPYYNLATESWWKSPFRVEGYDPLALDADLAAPRGPPGSAGPSKLGL